MKELTKAEEQIMHILWKLKKAFVKDIVEEMPPPRPAYNTVSTIIRILEKKGFVGHNAFGNTHEYFPVVTKKDYTRAFLKNFVHNYFSGSYQELVSFFAREDNMSVAELDELISEVKQELEPEKPDEDE